MEYIVDQALCAGHGACYRAAPNVYSLDEEGFNDCMGEAVSVPTDLIQEAQTGADACPESAIRVVHR